MEDLVLSTVFDGTVSSISTVWNGYACLYKDLGNLRLQIYAQVSLRDILRMHEDALRIRYSRNLRYRFGFLLFLR